MVGSAAYNDVGEGKEDSVGRLKTKLRSNAYMELGVLTCGPGVVSPNEIVALRLKRMRFRENTSIIN